MSALGAGLRPGDLPDLLGVPLSQEQLRAATADLGPGLIVAGAGSGKTTVMAARVVWLVGTGQTAVAGILGLTFTNKAAAELLQRIRGALRRLSPQAAAAADDAVVATYHAFAGQALREFGLLIGVEPSAELMSAVRQRQLAYRVVAGADIDHRHITAAPHDVAATMLALDSLLADSDVPVADLLAFDEELLAALQAQPDQQRAGERMLATAASRRAMARLVADYRAAKRDGELLDFADYVRLGAELARRHPQVGRVLRQRHEAVLLDEYQDTSVAQRGMLQALFAGGHAVTAVGDPCQAIYGWRGASPYNMDGFPRHFPGAQGQPAAVFTLATNRRSGAHILSLANEIAEGLRAVHSNVPQPRPEERNDTGSVVCGLLPTVEEESQWLVEQVRACGHPWRDIAVLARTNDAAAEVVGALRAAGIPVQVHGKQALLALPEVRWIMWALQLAADPTANDALVGLLMGPAWRIGQRDMALLARRAADLAAQGGPATAGPIGPSAELLAALSSDPLDTPCLLDALHDPGGARYPYSQEARQRFAAAARLLLGWQRRASSAVADQVRTIALESGLAGELALGARGGAPGAPDDDSALVALIDLARSFDDVERGRTLTDFLAWLAVAEDLPGGPEAPARPIAQAVTVMTVHASKGLEFPVVAVPGLVEGSFPSDRGRGRWPTSPGALPPALLSEPAAPAIAEFPADPTYPRASELAAFTAACRAADRLEEVRLAYVAVTRAKQRLILSGHRWGRTQRKPREPSEFLLAASHAAAAGRAALDVWALPPDDDADNPLLRQADHDAAGGDGDGRPDWQPVAAAVRSAAAAGPDASGSAEPAPGTESDPVVEGWDRDLAIIRAEFARRRAPLEVVLPADLSVSGWLAASRDPAAFALQSLRPVPRPASRGAAAGEEFHEWVAGREPQLALWEAEDLIDPLDAEPPSAQQAALRAAFAASSFGHLEPIAVEHPVAVRVGGHLIRGRIDAVFAIDGEHWLVDWKTTASGGADPLQLAVYRAAWSAQQGIPPELVVGCFVFVQQRRYEIYRGLPGVEDLPRAGSDATVTMAPTEVAEWEA